MSQRSTFLVLGASSAVFATLSSACGGATAPGATPYASDTSDASTPDASIDQAVGADAPGSAPGNARGNAPFTTGGRVGVGARGGGNAPSAANMSTSLLRLADWAPDAPGAGFDMCIRPVGGTGDWVGPLLGGGVAYPTVGSYVAVAPGTYDVTVLAPGRGACAAPVVATGTLPALATGSHATVALVGDLSPTGNDQAARIAAFLDDVVAPQAEAAVRFIDAMPGAQAVIFGTGSVANLTFSQLTSSVPFGGASSTPGDGGTPDRNAYLPMQPASGVMLSAHLPAGDFDVSSGSSTSLVDGGFVVQNDPGLLGGGATNLATGSNASWTAGSVVTVALLRGTSTGTAQMLLCQDTAPAQGALSVCTILAP
jgi:hypothetical protein